MKVKKEGEGQIGSGGEEKENSRERIRKYCNAREGEGRTTVETVHTVGH